MGNTQTTEQPNQSKQQNIPEVIINEKNGATGVVIDKKNIPNFKIVLIGDPEVGKTSIFLRYQRNMFLEDYRQTRKVVIENIVKTVNLPVKAVSSVTLWDIPGSEDMDLRASYYRNVDAAVVVVDLNDEDSIEMAGAWKQDFINKATKARLVDEGRGTEPRLEQLPCNPAKIPVLLLGNKFDIVEEGLKDERLRRTLAGKSLLANDGTVESVERNFKRMQRALGEEVKETDDNKPEDDDSAFPVVRGPRDTDPKPRCVQLLEEVEQEHGFVGSVMVSARDGDGSADRALQALVRYLLEKHYGKRKPKEKQLKNKKIEAPEVDNPPLLETGREEFDKLFKRCYTPMKRSVDYSTYYDVVLKRFKQSCADHGFLENGKPSLEDCILGIRNVLRVLGRMDLKIEPFESFVNLSYTLDPRVEVPREVNISLNVFNTEYAVVCNSIQRDCPIILGLLEKLDKKIERKCDEIPEIMQGKNEKAVARLIGICEQNRAKIAFVKSQLEKCIRTVESAKDKVKASLLW